MKRAYTDEDLNRTTFLNAAVQGDEDAWRVILHVCQSIAIGFARTHNVPRHLMESALGDALAKAWRKACSFKKDGNGTFRGWLRQVVTNSAIDVLRKEARQPVNDRDSLLNESSEDEHRTATSERIPDTDSFEFGARVDREADEALLREAVQNLRGRRGFNFEV